jgi:hypothetical protein
MEEESERNLPPESFRDRELSIDGKDKELVENDRSIGTLPVKPRKKALLIGINYYNSNSELRGCLEDVSNMQAYLSKRGYTQFTILKDNPSDINYKLPDCPTANNILAAMKSFVSSAVARDTLWIHFSGHGSQLVATDKSETDGLDECICPVDFDFYKKDSGFIRDNDLNAILVAALPAGVKLRVCFDCCHSGSALDLPYIWKTGMQVVRENYPIRDRDIIFISGCRDNQTSADAFINNNFAGAMSWSLLKTLTEVKPKDKLRWKDLVERMRSHLIQGGYDQVPQLSIINPNHINSFVDI